MFCHHCIMPHIVINRIGQSGNGQDLKKKRKAIRHHKPSVKKLGTNLLSSFDGKEVKAVL